MCYSSSDDEKLYLVFLAVPRPARAVVVFLANETKSSSSKSKFYRRIRDWLMRSFKAQALFQIQHTVGSQILGCFTSICSMRISSRTQDILNEWSSTVLKHGNPYLNHRPWNHRLPRIQPFSSFSTLRQASLEPVSWSSWWWARRNRLTLRFSSGLFCILGTIFPKERFLKKFANFYKWDFLLDLVRTTRCWISVDKKAFKQFNRINK